MRDAFIIRLYRDGDGLGINQLYNTVFKKQRDLKVWNWKFIENPVELEHVTSVAEMDGMIVGMYPSWARYYAFNKKTIPTVQPVDNCVHPDYRGGKIFKALHGEYRSRCLELGLAFAFGFATYRHGKLGKMLFDYRSLFEIPILIKRLNLRLAFRTRVPNRLLEKIVFFVSNKLYKILSLRSLSKGSKDYVIEQVNTFDEGFDSFWNRASQVFNIIGTRDSTYLNWRFINKPDDKNIIFRCIKDGDVQGYIVLKISQETSGERIALILDFIGLCDKASSKLLDTAITYFLRNKADYVKIFISDNNIMYTKLTERGFKKRGEPLRAAYELFDNTIERGFLEDKKNWFLTYGDTDLID